MLPGILQRPTVEPRLGCRAARPAVPQESLRHPRLVDEEALKEGLKTISGDGREGLVDDEEAEGMPTIVRS